MPKDLYFRELLSGGGWRGDLRMIWFALLYGAIMGVLLIMAVKGE